MAEDIKHEKWGGKRKGAGRPKVLERPNVKISTSVSAEVYDWVVSQPETISSFIHRILKERMEQEQNQ